MVLYRFVLASIVNIFFLSSAYCQIIYDAQELQILPPKWLNKWTTKVDEKLKSLEGQLDKQTTKYLNELNKIERRIQRKLQKVDSLAARNLADGSVFYSNLKRLQKKANAADHHLNGRYESYMDSLNCALSFFRQKSLLVDRDRLKAELNTTSQQLSKLLGKFNQADDIRSAIIARRALLQSTLSGYTRLPTSLKRSALGYRKTLFAYGRQLEQYKQLLSITSALEKKALKWLTKTIGFEQFFRNNSLLNVLFGNLVTNVSAGSVAGLQTRQQIENLVSVQLSSAGPNGVGMLQQNLQAAQAHLSVLKEKIGRYGQGAADLEMPDFMPNDQKKKSFWKRLEYGTNMQTAKSNGLFPTTTDLALSVAYKLNDKSSIGFGGSYKVGWGKDIRHIVFTSQGGSLRSFLDVKLKKSFYATGGFEYNYQPVADVSTPTGIMQADSWRKSGLIGISKIVAIKHKLLKKTKAQLLWDFLSYSQTPRMQPLKFRIGYNF